MRVGDARLPQLTKHPGVRDAPDLDLAGGAHGLERPAACSMLIAAIAGLIGIVFMVCHDRHHLACAPLGFGICDAQGAIDIRCDRLFSSGNTVRPSLCTALRMASDDRTAMVSRPPLTLHRATRSWATAPHPSTSTTYRVTAGSIVLAGQSPSIGLRPLRQLAESAARGGLRHPRSPAGTRPESDTEPNAQR
jgi:hypothetical protein